MKLGRRDSTTASLSLTDANLPKFTDDLDRLTSLFREKGLSERDMVALSGLSLINYSIIYRMGILIITTCNACKGNMTK